MYWFAFSIINSVGFGVIVIVEALNDDEDWVKLIHDHNYSSIRPQERYGILFVSQGVTDPFN